MLTIPLSVGHQTKTGSFRLSFCSRLSLTEQTGFQPPNLPRLGQRCIQRWSSDSSRSLDGSEDRRQLLGIENAPYCLDGDGIIHPDAYMYSNGRMGRCHVYTNTTNVLE